MSKSTQRKRKDSSADSPILKDQLVRDCLKIQLMTFPNKELFEEEIANWVRDLSPFPASAIEWAFENWRRNGRFFPVYGDIIDQCIGWEPADKPMRPVCDAECKSQHGKGYHWNDVYWLLAKLRAPCVTGPKDSRKEPIQPGEIEALMDELDAKRPGGAPEWRKTA